MNESARGTVFPTEVDELTPAVLGAALAERYPGVVVEGVEEANITRTVAAVQDLATFEAIEKLP